MKLRIAFGEANFKEHESLSSHMRRVCTMLKGELDDLHKNVAATDKCFDENPEYVVIEKETEIDDKKILIKMYRDKLDADRKMFVIQCFIPTFKDMNYISFIEVGRMMADGVVLYRDGRVESASDEELWLYR